MAQLLSVLLDDEDVIAQVLKQVVDEQLSHGKKEDVEIKITNKIWDVIAIFLSGNMMPDGQRVKNVQGAIHEFRISLPKSSSVVRILFALEKGMLVLLTGYLIKPLQYNDKQTTKKIDALYEIKIKEACEIFDDYKKVKQRYNYTLLPNHL